MTAKLDNRGLRRALGNFVTGVTVVTTTDEMDRPRGLTVNSFTSVSLEPPLLSVCIANHAASCKSFAQRRGFTINVLAEEQREISDRFATKSPDKFADLDWETGSTGAPRIQGSLATFDCTVHELVEAGDHLVVIGAVENFVVNPGSPLVYAQGGYVPLSPRETVMEQPQGELVIVSCIAETNGRIALVREQLDTGTQLVLPRTRPSASNRSGEVGPLRAAMESLGLQIEITFLYSVFNVNTPPAIHIVYRGFLQPGPDHAAAIELYAEDDIPWDDVHPAYRGMLRRFFRELRIHHFGVYMGGEAGGSVSPVSEAPQSWDEYHLRFANQRSNDA